MALIAFTKETNAQSWQWARRAGATGGGGGTEYDGVYDMKVDKNGNTYSLVVFDGGIRNISTSNNIPIDDSFPNVIGSQDVGIISYDKCGKLRWYKIMGGLGKDNATSLGLDTLGGVYAVFTNNQSNTQIGNINIPNPKRKGFGIVKFDTTGTYKWFKQPNSDTNSIAKNFTYGYPINSYTEKNGDTYIFCSLGTGLVSGSTNLVATIPHHYVLKYNSVGTPIELIKMDMSDSIPFSGGSNQFVRTKNGKFLISSQVDYSYVTNPVYLGTTQVSKPVLICCFSSTGQFVWKVENTAGSTTYSGVNILWDEQSHKIYFGGTFILGDGINGYHAQNLSGYTGTGLSTIGCLDSLGNTIWIKSAYQKKYSSGLKIGTITQNGNIYCSGNTVGEMDWGNGYQYNSNGQSFLAVFDMNSTNIISLDTTVKCTSGYTTIDIYGSDSFNNVYCGGLFNTDMFIGNQYYGKIGGDRDFFIAKYGTNNCGTTPLHFLNYSLQFKPENKSLIENYWTTSNEINVSRFNVQRSTNGKDYTTISTVSAMNKNLNEYRFDDDIKNIEAGVKTLYYRIESIDFDGSKTYSEIKNVEYRTRNNEVIGVYPNPAKELVTIACKDAKQLFIIDGWGKTVFQLQTGLEMTQKLSFNKI